MNSKTVTVAMPILVLWLCSALTAINALPDYERYHGKLERTEKLLRTHCSSWSWLKNSEYVSAQNVLVTKCFSKQT